MWVYTRVNYTYAGEHSVLPINVESLCRTLEMNIILYVDLLQLKKIAFKVQTRLLALKFVSRQVHLRQRLPCEDDTPNVSPWTVATGLTYFWKGGLGAARLLDGLLVAGRVFRLGDGAPKQGVLDDTLLGWRG